MKTERDVLIEIVVIIALPVPLGFLAGTAMTEFSIGPYWHVRRVASLMLAVLRGLAGRPALSSCHASAPIHSVRPAPQNIQNGVRRYRNGDPLVVYNCSGHPWKACPSR